MYYNKNKMFFLRNFRNINTHKNFFCNHLTTQNNLKKGIEITGFTFSPATLKTILTLEELGIENYEFETTPKIKTPEFIATKHPL